MEEGGGGVEVLQRGMVRRWSRVEEEEERGGGSPAPTMRMPKWVRWSHRQTVLLLEDSVEVLQPSAFQPPAPPGGGLQVLQHSSITATQELTELIGTHRSC